MTTYENFLTEGCCIIHQSNLIKHFKNIEDYKIENCEIFEEKEYESYIPKNVLSILKKVQIKIAEKHLKKIYNSFTLGNVGIWDGVDFGSQQWHNDSNEGKGVDCNFLLYFDDMSEKTGGALYVKGPFGEQKIYPKRDMLVWLNQSEKFLHKADTANTKRRLASFEFILPKT
jgi:predicted 2-oxoglutarate/Fe(II)-dependent dioxygenase YbiX